MNAEAVDVLKPMIMPIWWVNQSVSSLLVAVAAAAAAAAGHTSFRLSVTTCVGLLPSWSTVANAHLCEVCYYNISMY